MAVEHFAAGLGFHFLQRRRHAHGLAGLLATGFVDSFYGVPPVFAEVHHYPHAWHGFCGVE